MIELSLRSSGRKVAGDVMAAGAMSDYPLAPVMGVRMRGCRNGQRRLLSVQHRSPRLVQLLHTSAVVQRKIAGVAKLCEMSWKPQIGQWFR